MRDLEVFLSQNNMNYAECTFVRGGYVLRAEQYILNALTNAFRISAIMDKYPLIKEWAYQKTNAMRWFTRTQRTHSYERALALILARDCSRRVSTFRALCGVMSDAMSSQPATDDDFVRNLRRDESGSFGAFVRSR
jgi:hypothetical protein